MATPHPPDSAAAARPAARVRLRALGGLSLAPGHGAPADGGEAPNESPEPRSAAAPVHGVESAALATLATRRRKLALLLYLSRQPRPVSRELLATLLWGDDPPERARHNLTEALSHIRRVLGRDALSSRAQDVALSESAPLVLDVTEFEVAAERGDHASAVKRYTGAFLAGVFLDRAPAFDDWAARERARLHALFANACAHTITSLRADARHADAAIVAQRWLDEDVHDARAARALIEALAADGTREAGRNALAAYQRLRLRLHAEFGDEPDAEVSALARDIEEGRVPEVGAAAATKRREVSDSVASRSEVARGSEAAERPDVIEPVASVVPGNAASWPSRRAKTFLGLVAAALVASVAWVVVARANHTPAAPVRVLVAHTDDPLRDSVLDASLSMALGFGLSQSSSLDVVSATRTRDVLRLMRRPASDALDERTALEVGLRAGAARVIVPALARVGQRRALSARVLDAASGRTLTVVQATAESDDQLLGALDALRRDLQRALGAEARATSDLSPLPDVTTHSLGALRSYSAGLAFLARSRFDSADASLRQAIALDTGFAMAHAALGELLHLNNRPAEGDSALQRALARRARLSAREAMRIEALQARWQRRDDDAIRLQQQWLASHPLDRGTRSALAFDLHRARRRTEARDLYLALLSADSLDDDAWINLATVASGLPDSGNLALAQRAYARAFALVPEYRTNAWQNHQFGTLLVRAGQPDSAAGIFRLMLAGPPEQRARGYRSLGLLALAQDNPAGAAQLLDSAVRAHVETRDLLGETRGRLLLAAALSEGGRTAEMRTELATVRRVAAPGVTEPTMLYWAGKAMARNGMTRDAAALLEALKRRSVPANRRHEGAGLLLAGEIEVAAGRAANALPSLRRGVSLDSSEISLESLAFALERAGATAAADSAYRVVAAAPRFGWEGMLAQRSASRRLTNRVTP